MARQLPESGFLRYRSQAREAAGVGYFSDLSRGSPETGTAWWSKTMLAKYSPDLVTFMKRVDLEYPHYGQTMKLPFPETLESLANEAAENT
jgi:hypothetical protein